MATVIEPEHELLSTPLPTDFRALSVLQELAFPEQEQQNNYLRYHLYHKECPAKLELCRIVKLRSQKAGGAGSSDQEGDGDNVVVAACQLQLRPRRSDGVVDVFIEWIGCHPDHRGKGIGTMLLEWAEQFAKEILGATTLGLYMVRSNTNARRLYERNGFAAVHQQSRDNKDTMTVSAVSKKSRLRRFQRSFDRMFGHWSVLQMEKKLY
ncbi:unnamed protein product [Pseudo-nitzschia multistriata]|uniref:N-acetyltransferase domain-containing protein n=1 Tax=Pseudo-nitzschia multistriata TaxID=183589 RepID=A0A448ZKA2_9STRA|nr:unnamed protein product [Pseudo-nitzschia multistriata]